MRFPKRLRSPVVIAVTLIAAIACATITAPNSCAEESTWKAGLAAVKITPEQPMWMAGYASRTKPSEGVISELFAKAIAFEDAAGARAVIVTTDLIGIPRELRQQVARAVEEKHRIAPAALALNCSHTHCGPVVRDELETSVIYPLDAEQRAKVETYFVQLREKLIALIGSAVANLQPATLSHSRARCGFAMNRRLPTANGYQNSPYPDGPVDHDVPVLRVESAEGKLRGILFGYACHNTTTGVMQFNADYAGFAQREIEKAHPDAIALFVMGCGGDQNPYPRGQIDWAIAHGKTLATAVEAALLPKPQPIRGTLKYAFREIDLPFVAVTREDLLARKEIKDVFEERRTAALLDELQRNGRVRKSYPYPIQTLQLGDTLSLVFLGGEVVIDYALRLKRELGPSSTWIAGYSNDVMAYIPSDRVRTEGGYEGTDAMRYTNLPGPWQPGLEERIVAEVLKQRSELR